MAIASFSIFHLIAACYYYIDALIFSYGNGTESDKSYIESILRKDSELLFYVISRMLTWSGLHENVCNKATRPSVITWYASGVTFG